MRDKVGGIIGLFIRGILLLKRGIVFYGVFLGFYENIEDNKIFVYNVFFILLGFVGYSLFRKLGVACLFARVCWILLGFGICTGIVVGTFLGLRKGSLGREVLGEKRVEFNMYS